MYELTATKLWANGSGTDSHMSSGLENEASIILRALSVASSELVYTANQMVSDW